MITREQLVKELSRRTGVHFVDVRNILNAIPKAFIQWIRQGEDSLTLREFGTLRIMKMKPRKGMKGKGNQVMYPEQLLPRFKLQVGFIHELKKAAIFFKENPTLAAQNAAPKKGRRKKSERQAPKAYAHLHPGKRKIQVRPSGLPGENASPVHGKDLGQSSSEG